MWDKIINEFLSQIKPDLVIDMIVFVDVTRGHWFSHYIATVRIQRRI